MCDIITKRNDNFPTVSESLQMQSTYKERSIAFWDAVTQIEKFYSVFKNFVGDNSLTFKTTSPRREDNVAQLLATQVSRNMMTRVLNKYNKAFTTLLCPR